MEEPLLIPIENQGEGMEEPLLIPIANHREQNDTKEPLISNILPQEVIVSSPTSKYKKFCIALCIINAIEAVQVTSLSYVINYLEFGGRALSSNEKALLSAAIFLGMLVGGVLLSRVAARNGQKRCLVLCLWGSILTGSIGILAPCFEVLVLTRLLVGLWIGGLVPCIFTLGADLFPEQNRKLLLNVVASGYMAGSVASAGLGWALLAAAARGGAAGEREGEGEGEAAGGLPAVRLYLAMLHAGAAFAGAGAARALPESPRFLLRSKRNQTLINDTLGTFAVSMSSSSEDFRQEYSSQTTEYPELSKHISLHSVALAGVWFCLSFGSYGVLVWNNIIFTNLGLKNPYMISLLFCLADVPGNLISILLVTKIGQRMFLAISMSCVMVFTVVLAVLARIAPYHANDSHQTAVLVLTACLFEASSVASWNLLDASSAEFFDGALQVIGMGILSALGRTGSLISQVVNAELEDDIFTLLVIASATLTAGTVSAWCLVLPSRSKVFRTGNAY